MIFKAPAKVNLYLKILGKRPDGYHNLETIFERVSLYDYLDIERNSSNNTIITSSEDSIPTSPESLMGKAVRAFKKESGVSYNFNINLEKNIPTGAGLGGGSSDTASLLMGMNEISGNIIENKKLERIGASLGADIPFFMNGCSFALGKEKGDIIEIINTEAKIHHILVNPPFEISTKSVYEKLGPFILTKESAIDRIHSAFSSGNNLEKVYKYFCNDLQKVVLRDYPQLEKVFSELQNSGAEAVLLSGSGPTVFGVFGKEKVKEAEERLKTIFPQKEGWGVFSAETC